MSDRQEQPVTGDTAEDEGLWRVRHARRGVLRDAVLSGAVIADAEVGAFENAPENLGAFVPIALLGRALSPARAATNLFADVPLSGQVNLLAAGLLDQPAQLFSSAAPRNTTHVRLGAPVGDRGDWTASGALMRADISSWTVAGSYAARPGGRHRPDFSVSYSTQRYDGGNVLALRDVADGSRNAGSVYASDSVGLSPRLALAYGGSYGRYDYLDSQNLVSSHAELTFTPVDGFRLRAAVGRRALAPGAEEFLPPGDTGIWLPPQRTFSSLRADGRFQAERTTHVEVGIQKDILDTTVAIGAFRQHVDDQLVATFGADVPGQPDSTLGHYMVGNAGDVDAAGFVAAIRTTVAERIQGTVEYTWANAAITPDTGVRYLVFVEPSLGANGLTRLHTLSTSIEASVPETATRILVVCRVANASASLSPSRGNDEPDGTSAPDARFDVQLRQSLPFMNFSNARWEMLLAVRSVFREMASGQSVYDERLVVSPPKRVVGGVTLRF